MGLRRVFSASLALFFLSAASASAQYMADLNVTVSKPSVLPVWDIEDHQLNTTYSLNWHGTPDFGTALSDLIRKKRSAAAADKRDANVNVHIESQKDTQEGLIVLSVPGTDSGGSGGSGGGSGSGGSSGGSGGSSGTPLVPFNPDELAAELERRKNGETDFEEEEIYVAPDEEEEEEEPDFGDAPNTDYEVSTSVMDWFKQQNRITEAQNRLEELKQGLRKYGETKASSQTFKTYNSKIPDLEKSLSDAAIQYRRWYLNANRYRRRLQVRNIWQYRMQNSQYQTIRSAFDEIYKAHRAAQKRGVLAGIGFPSTHPTMTAITYKSVPIKNLQEFLDDLRRYVSLIARTVAQRGTRFRIQPKKIVGAAPGTRRIRLVNDGPRKNMNRDDIRFRLEQHQRELSVIQQSIASRPRSTSSQSTSSSQSQSSSSTSSTSRSSRSSRLRRLFSRNRRR